MSVCSRKKGCLCVERVEKCLTVTDNYISIDKKNIPRYDHNHLKKQLWEGEEESPWTSMDTIDGGQLKGIYDVHRASILDPDQVSDIVSIYNLPCDNSVNSVQIMDFVKEIYRQSKKAFKISFAAGLILQHVLIGEF